MTRSERIKEWAMYYRASPQKYNMNALLAVLKTDGEQMLQAVLKEIGLESALELVKDAAKNQ